MSERESLRRRLTQVVDDKEVIAGTWLAEILEAWEFQRVVPPGPEPWERGASYWLHRRYPSLQLPLVTPGLVHPEVSAAVLSMVHSALARETAGANAGTDLEGER